MTDVGHVVTRLNSLFKPGFASEDRVLMDAKGEMPTPGVYPKAPPVGIRKPRELQTLAQADGSFTEAGFFEEHSFVLLDHVSTNPTRRPRRASGRVASIASASSF